MSGFIEAVDKRRSIYAIGKDEVVKKDKISSIIKDLVMNVPSPYNMQSARVVLLFGDESAKLWKIVYDTLQKIVPADKFPRTAAKIDY